MIKTIVIEDEKFLRQGIVTATPWDSFGCVVVGEAGDAFEGLELIRKLEPDLVITDIRMPKMNGLELIAKAKELCDCEFIIISGHSEFQYAKQALSLGVRGYLLKPVDDGEFADVLQKTVFDITENRKQKALLRRVGSIDKNKELFIGVSDSSPLVKSKSRYLDSALMMIRENCGDDLTLKEIANRLFISERYLGKLFKENTNYTFLEYLTVCRIAKAVDQLDNSDKKIYTIAAEVGYSDTRYFSMIFKKIMGVTPTEYKNSGGDLGIADPIDKD